MENFINDDPRDEEYAFRGLANAWPPEDPDWRYANCTDEEWFDLLRHGISGVDYSKREYIIPRVPKRAWAFRCTNPYIGDGLPF